jgi:hypothetical protein
MKLFKFADACCGPVNMVLTSVNGANDFSNTRYSGVLPCLEMQP